VLQTQLKNVNFDPGTIDGVFGKNTARALIQFQNANGLKADGIFGPNTSRILFSS
jgi:peptidoglycan hydrolase-like protein with peptidoglycan-binding domain